MTLPDERFRAIQQARKLMEDLLDPGRTPRVPSIVRQRALGALRHYPSEWELEQISKNSPNYLDSRPFSVYNLS